jgi:hypothetical protein
LARISISGISPSTFVSALQSAAGVVHLEILVMCNTSSWSSDELHALAQCVDPLALQVLDIVAPPSLCGQLFPHARLHGES